MAVEDGVGDGCRLASCLQIMHPQDVRPGQDGGRRWRRRSRCGAPRDHILPDGTAPASRRRPESSCERGPTSSGLPSSCSRPQAGEQREVFRAALAKAEARIDDDALACESRPPPPAPSARTARQRPPAQRVRCPEAAACANLAERPRECISTRPQPLCATTAAIAGSQVRPETSLMISAPARAAARAVAAW